MSEDKQKSNIWLNSLPITRPSKGAAGKTGTWRVFNPIIDRSKCTRCLLCWIFCPEGCIERRSSEDVEVDLNFCKGCGICAQECRLKAITMKREEE